MLNLKSRFLFKRQGGLLTFFQTRTTPVPDKNQSYARLKKGKRDPPCRLNKKRDFRTSGTCSKLPVTGSCSAFQVTNKNLNFGICYRPFYKGPGGNTALGGNA
eukprot:sb/3478249/